MSKFALGEIVSTSGIDARSKDDPAFYQFVCESIMRYAQCDWGDSDEEDKKTNDDAVRYGERILAAYIYPKTQERIWIVTEWDRSVTTVLFPDEY